MAIPIFMLHKIIKWQKEENGENSTRSVLGSWLVDGVTDAYDCAQQDPINWPIYTCQGEASYVFSKKERVTHSCIIYG